MSVNIVLPTLTQWTKNHVTSIIQAKSQADLEAAVDAFLSKSATINVNGAQLTRDAFVKQLSQENFDEQGATVNFNASVEARADPNDGFTVCAFYVNHVPGAWLILFEGWLRRSILHRRRCRGYTSFGRACV